MFEETRVPLVLAEGQMVRLLPVLAPACGCEVRRQKLALVAHDADRDLAEDTHVARLFAQETQPRSFDAGRGRTDETGILLLEGGDDRLEEQLLLELGGLIRDLDERIDASGALCGREKK
jgi:hypothetical protein